MNQEILIVRAGQGQWIASGAGHTVRATTPWIALDLLEERAKFFDEGQNSRKRLVESQSDTDTGDTVAPVEGQEEISKGDKNALVALPIAFEESESVVSISRN